MKSKLLHSTVTLLEAIFLSFKFAKATVSTGFLIMDSETFDLIANQFDTCPSKEVHEAFVQVRTVLEEIDGMENMVVAHVDIEKDGMILYQYPVTRYGRQGAIFQEYLPKMFLFVKNKDTAAGRSHESYRAYNFKEQTRQDTLDFSPDAIRNFILVKSGIVLALSGDIDEVDFIPIKLMVKLMQQAVDSG